MFFLMPNQQCQSTEGHDGTFFDAAGKFRENQRRACSRSASIRYAYRHVFASNKALVSINIMLSLHVLSVECEPITATRPSIHHINATG